MSLTHSLTHSNPPSLPPSLRHAILLKLITIDILKNCFISSLIFGLQKFKDSVGNCASNVADLAVYINKPIWFLSPSKHKSSHSPNTKIHNWVLDWYRWAIQISVWARPFDQIIVFQDLDHTEVEIIIPRTRCGFTSKDIRTIVLRYPIEISFPFLLSQSTPFLHYTLLFFSRKYSYVTFSFSFGHNDNKN